MKWRTYEKHSDEHNNHDARVSHDQVNNLANSQYKNWWSSKKIKNCVECIVVTLQQIIPIGRMESVKLQILNFLAFIYVPLVSEISYLIRKSC